jgi:hypothetical protein
MRFGKVNGLLGHRLKRTPVQVRGAPDCDQIPLGRGHAKIWLMFIDDVLVRVDVEKGATTLARIAAGDPVERVFSAYAKVEAEPNAYDERERYLTVYSKDGRAALRFETHAGKIGIFYAGTARAVHLTEGCS